MRFESLRARLVCACAGAVFTGLFTSAAPAAIVASDGFGDGDRDNNGLDAGATVTNASDVGLRWFVVGGTSAVTRQVVDDSAGIGSGNALQLFNTASNNRPMVANFNEVTLADGEAIVLRFDMRVLSVKNTAGADITADRAIRFGLYNDGGAGSRVTSDQGSTSTLTDGDLGYNVRLDAGDDVSNNTSMDVTRDDSSTGLIQGTANGISISSSNVNNKLDDATKRHFELTLKRVGTGLLISLQQDSNPTISGTDANPIGFTFNEIAFGPRSNAAMDLRLDNVQVEHVVPEPTSLALLALGGSALLARRRRGAR